MNLPNLKVKYRALRRAALKRWLEFRYRNQDGNTCCCGSDLGKGGDICHHGGCRSMKDYVIEKELERLGC